LIVAISFFALPYLVDVVYLDDLAPTHSAQEIVSDKDRDFDDEIRVAAVDVQQSERLIEHSDFLARRPSFLRKGADSAFGRFEHLITASLISLPPPGA
jgi:hypothetical protein